MDEMSFINMILPYVVSIVVFTLVGIGFYLKDVVFNFLDRKKQDHYRRKYGLTQNSNSYRVKKVKKNAKSA